MNFKVRKIKTTKTKKKNIFSLIIVWCQKNKKLAISLVVILLLLGGRFVFETFNVGKIKTPRIFSSGPLKTGKNGHTNILLLGVAGKTKEGGHLSDSIMLASIDPERPSISMLSFPRDLFVSSKVGNRKINEIYAAAQYKYGEEKGIEITKKALEDFAGIEIQYAAVVDFDIFQDGIDLLGGVDIFVPKDIIDPFYPDGEYGFETFVVRKGLQHFDGETALKYARSRKTTSDYDRAKRQQDLALAIRTKIEANGWADNLSKLREFYDVFRRRVNTDLGLIEMSALAKLGMGIDYGDIVSAVLNDDPGQNGGLLYAPAREFYNGQFVLLPKSKKDNQKFIELTLIDPDILLENAQISILNGPGEEGKAGKLGRRLRRLGFHVAEIDNYKTDNVAESFVQVFTEQPKTMKFLNEFIKLKKIIPQTTVMEGDGIIDIQIILGKDYVSTYVEEEIQTELKLKSHDSMTLQKNE
jgi:LCP family protein required for cell wall assembly